MELKKGTLFFLMTIFALLVNGQKIENLKASFRGGGVVLITYDLTGGSARQQYNIQLFSSNDTFQNPLTEVVGDVGPNIATGVQKQAEWNAAKALTKFKGEISF